jgi:hypothetical protein
MGVERLITPSKGRVRRTPGTGVVWLASRGYNSRVIIGGSAFRWNCTRRGDVVHEQDAGDSILLGPRLVESTATSELEGD